MSQKMSSGRKSFPLSLRLSLWLMSAAVLPLIVASVMNEIQSRPTLINQSSVTLETDAQTHAQLIDTYLAGKMLGIKSLDYSPLVQQYYLSPPADQVNVPTITQNGLAIQKLVNPEVTLSVFFTPQGQLRFSYSNYGVQPKPHGKYLIPPEDLQKIPLGQQFLSGVYYDAATHKSTVDLYTPVYIAAVKKVVGVVRDTLSLDIIWNIVNSEKGANGNGSSAFILDQNGVRIFDPDTNNLFTTIAPLAPQLQQTISDQNLYGQPNALTLVTDTNLSNIQSQPQPVLTTFQETPAGKDETYQITRRSLTAVPWTYFVQTPVNVVITLANQQLLFIALIALFVLIPAAVVGWIVGNRISFPILRSVESLVGNSSALNDLAEKEKNAALEQVWVVDSSEVGLKSIQYYTNASRVAVRQLNELGKDLLQRPDKDMPSTLDVVAQMVNIGQYFEKAIEYQEESNNKVAIAIKVTNEVTEQLASGAKSASEAANELDRVVNQLRHIVGS